MMGVSFNDGMVSVSFVAEGPRNRVYQNCPLQSVLYQFEGVEVVIFGKTRSNSVISWPNQESTQAGGCRCSPVCPSDAALTWFPTKRKILLS